MAVKRKYRLNLRNYGNLPAIMLSQYDEGYALEFEIRDGTDAASDLSAYTVTLKGTRADTLAYSFAGTVSTNVLTFVIDTTMTACDGRGTAEIAIKDTANDVLFATFNMPVFVERAAVPEGSIDADVERAQEIAEQVQEIVDNAAAAVSGEAEKWATGQINGTDVPSTDPAYENNAKYYAEQAADSAASIGIDATLTQTGKAADAKKTGDEITALKEDLNDSQIVSIVDLTNYTQGYITSTGAISTNSDLGRIDGIVLRKGSKISLTAKGYSNVIAMIYRCNSDGTYTCLVASDSNSVKTYEYTATENMIVGLSFYVGSNQRNAEVFLAVSDALNTVTPKYSYLTVGTGKQYTDIKSAINAVTNPSASNRYVIYVYEGQYNTYGSSQLSSSYKGLILPDYTDIIGIGNRDNIVLYFRGTTETSSYNNNISTLNVGGHNTIENITIIGKHCRYAVHDDFLATGETEQTYKNVKFLVEAADSSSMASASTNVPYGCGAEIQKKLVFKNCIFENGNNYANFFYHDVTAASMIMGAVISFVNCRFVSGRYSIQLTKYNTPKESRIYLYGCKADNGGFIRGDGTTVNTMYISGFASQGFTFTGNGTISQEDIDACIDFI